MEGFERACGGSREKVLQSRKASTAQNMKFSGKKIIAIKSDNILPYFKANLCLYQTLPLSIKFHEDPCINARARVVSARTRDKTCARTLTTSARAFMNGSS